MTPSVGCGVLIRLKFDCDRFCCRLMRMEILNDLFYLKIVSSKRSIQTTRFS